MEKASPWLDDRGMVGYSRDRHRKRCMAEQSMAWNEVTGPAGRQELDMHLYGHATSELTELVSVFKRQL